MSDDWSDTIAIIGGGPAGCVLANRLLATTSHKVLLLERGPVETPTKDYRTFPQGLNAHATWHSSTPQTALKDRKLWLHTAAGLGGASLLNAGVFMMGRPQNYDWPGSHFTFANFERAVQAVRAIHQPKVISKGLMPENTPAGKIERQVLTKFGFQGTTGKSLLWMEEDGIYYLQSSAQSDSGDGSLLRRTAADSFLSEDVRANPRLTIRTDVTVLRLLTETTKERLLQVTGIEYNSPLRIAGVRVWSTTEQLLGFREVVCCAGAIETPRLLLRSGIGPRSELDAANIPVKLEANEVGKNLYDHPIAFFPVELEEDVPPEFPPCRTPADNNVTVKTYGTDQKVVFYHMGPQIAYHVHAEILVPRFDGRSLRRTAEVTLLNALRPFVYPTSNTQLGVVAVGLLTRKSKGSVGWNHIDPQYLAEKEDLDAFVDAFGDMLEMLRQAHMKVAIPNFDMNPQGEALVQSARMMAGPFWHFAGSCSKVVDADTLVVQGTTNLRIVDASVIPVNVEANTQGSVMAMAYLAAELF